MKMIIEFLPTMSPLKMYLMGPTAINDDLIDYPAISFRLKPQGVHHIMGKELTLNNATFWWASRERSI